MLLISSMILLMQFAAALRRVACVSADLNLSTAAMTTSRDLTIVCEISRIDALISSLPAATDLISARSSPALILATAFAVTSAAYFTTLNGFPFKSRIGL